MSLLGSCRWSLFNLQLCIDGSSSGTSLATYQDVSSLQAHVSTVEADACPWLIMQCHYLSSTLLLPLESLQLCIGESSSGASLAILQEVSSFGGCFLLGWWRNKHVSSCRRCMYLIVSHTHIVCWTLSPLTPLKRGVTFALPIIASFTCRYLLLNNFSLSPSHLELNETDTLLAQRCRG